MDGHEAVDKYFYLFERKGNWVSMFEFDDYYSNHI